ncbi:flagellar protein FlaG [Motilimonas cestriensis]|uniref:Flagellar protein FlaG n=1 Tax=Motilimonas cestriensis TaxID=2742685 RepID=A0ABS8WBH0_9GAMM|nr:flagellar protein FlaG [Motilimonas cestriensis]MCE2595598.1 flagellar protein FlaG [Motilimonas cestriensis]
MKTTNQIYVADPSLLTGASSFKNDPRKSDNSTILSKDTTGIDSSVSASVTSTKRVEDTDKLKDHNNVEKVDKVDVEDAISTVHKFIDSNKRGVSFSIDDSTEKMVIKVIDKNTNETVKQMPSEEFLKIAEKIKALETDFSSKIGMLIDGIA